MVTRKCESSKIPRGPPLRMILAAQETTEGIMKVLDTKIPLLKEKRDQLAILLRPEEETGIGLEPHRRMLNAEQLLRRLLDSFEVMEMRGQLFSSLLRAWTNKDNGQASSDNDVPMSQNVINTDSGRQHYQDWIKSTKILLRSIRISFKSSLCSLELIKLQISCVKNVLASRQADSLVLQKLKTAKKQLKAWIKTFGLTEEFIDALEHSLSGTIVWFNDGDVQTYDTSKPPCPPQKRGRGRPRRYVSGVCQ